MDSFVQYFQKNTKCINENKYIIGLSMITLNIGARYIIDELNTDLRDLVNKTIIRRTIIFCSFFMATRDLLTAIILSIIFILMINEIFVFEKEENVIESEGQISLNRNEIDKIIIQLQNMKVNL